MKHIKEVVYITRIKHLIETFDDDKVLQDILDIVILSGDIAKGIKVTENDMEDYRYIGQLIEKSKLSLKKAYAVIKVR